MKRYKVFEILRLLEENGWIKVAQRGSHRQYKHPTIIGKVTVNGKERETLSVKRF